MQQRRRRRIPLSFIVGGIAIISAVLYLVFANTKASAVYYMTVPELRQCTNCSAQDVRVAGIVQQGSIKYADGQQQVQFVIAQGNQGVPVIYNGVLPDIFRAGVQVVVEGHYQGPGAFQAQTLLAKCPSKFQAATPKP